jgi:hypothetical protein
MKVDLEKGINIQIKGELGKYNSLPIESLVKIAESFQSLIFSIANADNSNDFFDINNFKIELSGFSSGSAIPQFKFSPREEYRDAFNCKDQREIVNQRLTDLLEISDDGDYTKLLKIYPDPVVRTPIVENFYTFVSGFGSSPVTIVEKGIDSFTPIFGIHKFNSKVKDTLVIKMPLAIESESQEGGTAVAKVRITHKKGRTIKKIMNLYNQDKYSIEYAPSIIVCGLNKYILNHPLRCMFEKEEEYYVIHSEILDIIATGETQDEAENAFGVEFEFVYELLNSHDDTQLTKHNQFIKKAINKLVKRIEK